MFDLALVGYKGSPHSIIDCNPMSLEKDDDGFVTHVTGDLDAFISLIC